MSTLKRAIKKKKVHENLPIVAASSSAYSFRERPMQNDVSSFSLRKLQNHETSLHSKTHVTSTTDLGRTVSATSSSTLNSRNGDTGNKKRGRPAAATISSSYSFRQRPKGNVTAKSKKNDSSNQERDTVSESGMDDMHQLQNNNVSESGMDGESEPLEKDKLEMGDAFDQMGDIYMPEENDVIQVLNVNVSPSEKDTAFVPNDNVFQQEMEGIPEVMEEDVAVSSNNCVPGPMEEIFLPEEKDVSQGLNDNVSQPEKDTVSASLSDNAPNPKKDDGTTLVPKSKSFNVAEMRAMFAECDADKFKMYQRMYRMETQVIKNAYRLKYIALRTAANPHDLSVFTEPPVEFEVKERDRIFSGTFSAFQPKNIFESSDEEEEAK